MLVAIGGIGIWAAATLASGRSGGRAADSVTTVTLTGISATVPATTDTTPVTPSSLRSDRHCAAARSHSGPVGANVRPLT